MDKKRLKYYYSFNPVGVMRFSGLYLIRPESVPDHVSGCTSLALMMYKDLEALGIKVNIERLVFKIALHDLPETITSDIVRPIKYHHEELLNEFRKAEQSLLKSSGLTDDIIEEINNAKDDSLEGKLMRVIDVLQCYLKLLEESEDLNNKLVDPELKKCKSVLFRNIDQFDDEEVRIYLFKIYNSLI